MSDLYPGPRYRILDPFIEAVDSLEKSLAALFRLLALDAIYPRITDFFPDEINLDEPETLIGNGTQLRHRMLTIIDKGVTEPFMVQSVAMVVTDIFRAEFEAEKADYQTKKDAGLANNDYGSVRRAEFNHNDVRRAMEPFLTNEGIIRLRDSE